MTNNPYLSVIIPVYNESARIQNLPTIIKYLDSKKFSSEIIVVNDGSRDDTVEKLKKMKRQNKFKILSYKKNKGKGYAIKTGMLIAKGKYHLFTDIDLSTPMAEFNNFIPYLENYDLVIGSRKMKGAKLIEHQPIIRETLGKCFTFLSQIILNTHVSDFTCGFKCFSKKASSEIFKSLTIDRWGFDSEILFLATKKKLPIKEVSVRWSNDPNTKVKFPQDIIRSLSDLIRIRINDFHKMYPK